MKTKHHLMAAALGTAFLTLAIHGTAQAQLTVDGSGGVDLGNAGFISGAPILTFADGSSLTWASSPDLQNFVVPAGQLTGLDSSGNAINYEDLLPIKATKLSVMAGAAGAAPTGTGTIIDSAGIETNGLELLDTATSTAIPLTVTNGTLKVNGSTVGVGTNGNVDQALAPAAPGSVMAQIPAGTLTTLKEAAANISITAFKMGRTEVTFGEWYQGMRWACQNGYGFATTSSSFWDNSGRTTPQLSVDMSTAGTSPVVIKFAGAAANEIANAGGHSLGGFYDPVVGVNWFDVLKWCNARSQMDGYTPVYYVDTNTNGTYDSGTDTLYQTGEPTHTTLIVNPAATGFRLPTEAEWEWAARGGNMTANIYPWGTTTVSGVNANYQNLNVSIAPYRGRTTPVGSFPAGVNPYGLLDLSGNVGEWCYDFGVGGRVFRGNAFNDATPGRVSSSASVSPALRYANFGFRIVRN